MRKIGVGVFLTLCVGGAILLWSGRANTTDRQALKKALRLPPGVQKSPRAASLLQSDSHLFVARQYGRLPMAFEPNVGQTSPQAKFLARGSGYVAFLTDRRAVLALRHAEPSARTSSPRRRSASAREKTVALSIALAGANPHGRLVAQEELPGKSNYLIGNVPSKWHTDVANYRQVVERSVYPGIDLVYDGTQGSLEYDFLVAPGAKPGRIQLAIDGARNLRVDRAGNLTLSLAGGDVRLDRPVAYQQAAGKRSAVTIAYVVRNSHQVALRLGKYDRSLPLVIDPTLQYSTYLGGSGIDTGNGIAVAGDNTAFVTGSTLSPNFPTVNALFQNALGGQDVFVSKLSADGSKLLYSTYLGGSSDDFGNGIAVDTAGEAYVTGSTTSTNFPVYPATVPFPNCGGDGQCGASWNDQGLIASNGFVTKLNVFGTGIVYSTYIGVYEHVVSQAIAVDTSGIAYITGQIGPSFQVSNTNLAPNLCPNPFPVVNGFQGGIAGSSISNLDVNACPFEVGGAATNAFVMALSSSGTSILYSSYLGGTVQDVGLGIATDNASHAFVTGLTYSPDFLAIPAAAAGVDLFYGGSGDAFLTDVDITANGLASLLYSTYIGGSGLDQGNAVAVDSAGNTYVAGQTSSATQNGSVAAVNTYSGNGDAFVVEIPHSLIGAVQATFYYLGGSLADSAKGIALDSSDNVYVTGSTVSPDFPLVDPFQPKYGGGNADAFVTKIDPTLTTLLYSSYLGGSNTDAGNGIAVDSSGSAYVTGQTCSEDFPLANPLQPAEGGNCDAFVSKVTTLAGLSISPAGLVFSAQSLGTTSLPQTVNVTNTSTVTVNFTSIALGGADPGDFAQTNTCGTSLGASLTCTITVTFTPTASGIRKAEIDLTDDAVGSPQVVSLSGSTSTLQLSASSLAFGNQVVNTTSAPQSITATNNGTVAITFSGISASGAFAETDDCLKAPLQPGTNCAINVTFTPISAGNAVGALLLNDSAPGSPQEISLTGTGVSSSTATLQFSPTSVNFNNVTIGTVSPVQNVMVTNAGSVAVTFTSIATGGPPFSETDNCTSAALQPSNSCTVSVTFTPTAAGTVTGALAFTDSAAGSPQSVTLSGTGTTSQFDFTLVANTPSATVSAGQTANFGLTLAPVGTVSGSVNLSCSGLPTGATCSTATNPVAVSGTTNVTLSILTTARTLVPAVPQPPLGPPSVLKIVLLAWLGVLLLALLLGYAFPALRLRRALSVLALAMTVALLSAACNGGTKTGATGGGTPAGTYSVGVTGTSGSVSHSTTVSLQVK